MTHDTEGNITIVDRIKDMIKVRICSMMGNFISVCSMHCPGERAAGLPNRVGRSVGQGIKSFLTHEFHFDLVTCLNQENDRGAG